MPRFHCLLVVRDEGDIVDGALDHLLSWADHVYVHDTGSLDGTWDAVCERARHDDRVVPFRSEPIVFGPGVRSVLFAAYRDRFARGDWICRADADEVYDVPPPAFVAGLAPRESLVHYQLLQFRFTESDLRAWAAGDPPALDAYEVIAYSEPRLFRYRPSMKWPADRWRPYDQGVTARRRIPIRHYQHRSPPQMARRWAIRSWNAERGLPSPSASRHWRAASWRDWVVADDDPRLRRGPHPPPGPPPRARRLRERLVLDPLRRGFDAGDAPRRLTAAEQREIADRIAQAEREVAATFGEVAGLSPPARPRSA